MDCSQCQARTKSGARCKKRTCRQYPYCWIHLKSIDKLQVKKSGVAGKGLFYVGKQDFPKDKKIVDYSARTISRHPNPGSEYDLQVGQNRYLDSNSPLNYVGRYINDKHGTGQAANVRFTKGSRIYEKNNRYTVPIYSKKKIKPDSELLMSYGRLWNWNE